MDNFEHIKGEIVDDTELSTYIESIYGNKYVALSNAFIQARKKTSLLESKIELLAIHKMNDSMFSIPKKDADGTDYSVHAVRINMSEIKKLMNLNYGAFYTKVQEIAYGLKQKIYIYKDPDKKEFQMKSLYGDVSYRSGELTIEFNPDTEYLFLELKDNFTKIKLDVAFMFQTNGGFQIYKLLESYAYTLPSINLDVSQEEQESILKEFSVSEFRLQLGYVDISQPDIQKEGAKKNPDVEKMLSQEKKPKHKKWSDFLSRVVEPGIDECNKISDIYVTFVGTNKGAHGKIISIILKIQKNLEFYQKKGKEPEEVQENKVLSEDEIDDFLDEVRAYISESIKTRDLKAIAEESGYNHEKIKIAYELTKGKNIDNFVGFMIAAIKNGYEKTGKKREQTFEKSDYDFDELEKELLK